MAGPKKLRYVGPFAEVDVPALGKRVRRNHQVEVDGPLAARLLEQADWEEVGAKSRAKAEGQADAPPVESPARKGG